MSKNRHPDAENQPGLPTPDPARINAQLERILDHQAFADCARSQEFLRYVVNETLEGRAGRVKGAAIAHEVFQLSDPEHAQTSTVVRVEAGRLRRRLDRYYSEDGRDDPIRINIPKGSYVPVFEPLVAKEAVRREQPPVALPEVTPWMRWVTSGPMRFGALFFLTTAAILVWAVLVFQEEPDEPVARVPSKPSIAVLPFENASTDASKMELTTRFGPGGSTAS